MFQQTSGLSLHLPMLNAQVPLGQISVDWVMSSSSEVFKTDQSGGGSMSAKFLIRIFFFYFSQAKLAKRSQERQSWNAGLVT